MKLWRISFGFLRTMYDNLNIPSDSADHIFRLACQVSRVFYLNLADREDEFFLVKAAVNYGRFIAQISSVPLNLFHKLVKFRFDAWSTQSTLP